MRSKDFWTKLWHLQIHLVEVVNIMIEFDKALRKNTSR